MPAEERLANLLSDNVLPRLVSELEVLPWVLRKAPEPLDPIRQHLVATKHNHTDRTPFYRDFHLDSGSGVRR